MDRSAQATGEQAIRRPRTGSECEEPRRESLDVAFRLRPEQLAGPTSRAGAEAPHPEARAPAERAGDVLHAVASAVGEIPLDDIHGTAVRRITELTFGREAPLEPPIEVRARAVDAHELSAGRHLVVIDCELTNRSGDCVAAFAVETETVGEDPTDPGPDLECVDNIPV